MPLKRAAGLDHDPPELGPLRHEPLIVRIVRPVGRMRDLVDVRRHASELPVDRAKRLHRRAVDLQKAADPPGCNPQGAVSVEAKARNLGIEFGKFGLGQTDRDRSISTRLLLRRLRILPFAADHPAILPAGGVAVRCAALAGSAGGLGLGHRQMFYIYIYPATYLTQPSHSFQPLLHSSSRHLHQRVPRDRLGIDRRA